MLVIIKKGENLTASMKIAKEVFVKYLAFQDTEILEITLEEAYKLNRLF